MGTMVTFFFSGFVMGKVPFSLSPRFRPMLQRGVDLASLDVSYFTGEGVCVCVWGGVFGVGGRPAAPRAPWMGGGGEVGCVCLNFGRALEPRATIRQTCTSTRMHAHTQQKQLRH